MRREDPTEQRWLSAEGARRLRTSRRWPVLNGWEAPEAPAANRQIGEAPQAQGLVDASIFAQGVLSGERLYLSVLPSGVVVRTRSFVGPGRRGDGRGVVCGMSEDSRRDLLRRLAGIDFGQYDCHFVTLTYDRVWSSDCLKWKAQLHHFERELERRYGHDLLGGVWKLEFQRRGAPHFHVLLFWRRCPVRKGLIRFVSETWNRLVDRGNALHLAAGTKVQRCYNRTGPGVRKLMNYLAKYLGKAFDSGGVHTGRCWGQFGDIPSSRIAEVVIDGREACDRFLENVRVFGARSKFLSSLRQVCDGMLIYGDGIELSSCLLDGVSCTVHLCRGGEILPDG